MLRSILLKTLRDQRRGLMWWAIGISVLAIITMLFFPSLSDTPEINDLFGDMDDNPILKAFVGDITDFTSPEGFLNSQLFFLMIPLLFMVIAISQGSGAIAGEEERGTLDLLLSYPVSRLKVLMEKFLAMVAAILLLAFVLWVSVAMGAVAVSMDISFLRVAEAVISSALLGIAFGSLALMLGSAWGRRGMAIGIASAVGVAAYFLNALAPAVDVLEPLRKLSPFDYYIGADPLTNGLNFLHAAVLAGMAIVLLGIALVTFNRRDLAV